MELKQAIKETTESIIEQIIDTRRYFHKYPELSFQEYNTSEYIRQLLDEWEVHYKYPFAGTGILAEISGKLEGNKVIALRSDMDALPISENSGLDFSSENEGVMHACGHDIHMASLLGVISVLNELRNHFGGKILFIFQPGEEKLPGGAKLMLEEGLFQDNQPDLIIAQHVLPEMETGTVGFRAGAYMASSDEIFITVKGHGGHGALPEKIDDPVLMTAQILTTLQQEINRRSPKGTPTVLSFGKVIADGAVNVIPDEVRLEGTFRTMNEKWRKEAHQLIKRIGSGIAEGMGGNIELEIKHGYPALQNNVPATHRAKKYATALLGEDHVTDMDIRMTAEDFAWFSNAYPAFLYRLGVKSLTKRDVTPLHTSHFVADEKALLTGITTMSWIAVKFLAETD
ncbi:MAG TPA: M20 family metallopeptidase [Bacteroidales bacterium]|nr:M20 family metallopeptidase [Bacteroidales bacterium]